ncbi:MAG: hypothetical protein JWL75_584 [Parcubacteria group bacterium]|nr:hypothetical protein [Parcubacteria group bacterium]
MEGFNSFSPSAHKESPPDPWQQEVAAIDEESRRFDEASRARIEHAKHAAGSLNGPAWREKMALAGFEEGAEIDERSGVINGQPFHIMGVSHIPETFLLRRKELELAIANAGVIVLEGAPELAALYGEPYKDELRQKFKAEGKSAAEAEAWIKQNFEDPNFNPFFHELEQLAKKHKKSVITIDPHSGIGRTNYRTLREDGTVDDALTGRSDNVNVGVQGAWAASVALGGYVALSHEREKQSSSSDEPVQMSRRKFLTGLAAGVGAAALTPTAIANLGDASMLESVSYDVIDYRNTAVARGIDAYTKKHKVDGPVTLFYGKNHANGLERYLKNPGLRDAKYELYAPLRGVSEPRLEEYRFEEKDNTHTYAWQHVRTESV